MSLLPVLTFTYPPPQCDSRMSLLNFVTFKRKELEVLPSEEQTFNLLAQLQQDTINIQLLPYFHN